MPDERGHGPERICRCVPAQRSIAQVKGHGDVEVESAPEEHRTGDEEYLPRRGGNTRTPRRAIGRFVPQARQPDAVGACRPQDLPVERLVVEPQRAVTQLVVASVLEAQEAGRT